MSVSVKLKHIEAMRFKVDLADGREIELNSADEMGKAYAPMELFLISLAGCTAIDVQWILSRQRQKVESLEISVVGKRRDEDPRYYQMIDLEYTITGQNIRTDAVERAIRLSQEKYCSVRAMLKDAVKLNVTYRIISGAGSEHKYVYTARTQDGRKLAP
jgi:putative redox protein